MRNAILALVAACMVTVPASFAQNKQHERADAAHHQASTEMRVQHRVQFLTTVLSLSATQQQKATSIFTNAANANSMVFSELKTARHSLEMDIKGNQPAGTIKQVSNTIGTDVGQLVANEASAYEQFYQTLSPEQQTKATQLAKEMHGRFVAGLGGFDARG